MMSKDLAALCRELAWSQWVALGVSGKGAAPQHAIDLEAAIAFLPALEALDPRLYAEALDWCIQFAADYVSVSVLKSFLGLFSTAHQVAFASVAAIVNAGSSNKWPMIDKGSERAGLLHVEHFVPSGKSQRRSDGAVAVQLRARKIFGVSARADILQVLALLDPAAGYPAWIHVNGFASLGYQKRNLSRALTDLCDGGVVKAHKVANTVRYEFLQAEPVRALLAPLPATSGQPWGPLLALAAALLEVHAITHHKSLTTQGVEVMKTLAALRPLLSRFDCDVPTLQAGDPWSQLQPWLAHELQP
jgi:hypothetical protein